MKHGALTAILLLVVNGAAAAAPPRTLLLVDDHHVLYHSGVRRAVVPLVRHEKNPLIPGKPNGQLGYCSTYRDPKTGKYQFWYQTTAGGHGVAYAESDDGITWTLPALDIVKLNDPTQRNIVLTSEDHYGASVVVDAPGGSDPQRRYKMAYWSIPPVEGPTPPDGDKRGPKGGVYVAFSLDGIHWRKHPELVIRGAYGRSSQPPQVGDTSYRWGPPLTTSDVVDASWDPIRKRYVIYAKGWIDAPDGTTFWKRSIVRTESEDFITWSKPQLVMAADEFDGHRPAQYGGTRKGVQLHGAPVFVHENVYFALLQPAFFDTHGHQPIELAISRDGIDWQRPWRSTFLLPVDGGTSFDSGRIWSSSTPVILDDEIRFYYGAYEHPWNTSPKDPKSGIGLATMKRDRFVAVRPIEQVGQITLKPIRLESADGITINAEGSKGSVRVELLNEDGYRVKGFTKADVVPITTDGLRHRVAWSKPGSQFTPGSYVIRVHLDRADLFAITVPESKANE
jgi:hypothetical protein